MRPCQYGLVRQRHDRILVVGNGPTAREAPIELLPAEIPVIAVNGAIEGVPRADYWFTLDTSPVNLRRMTERRAGVLYFAAVPPEFGDMRARNPRFHVKPPAGIIYLRLIQRSGLSDHPGCIYGEGNSGFGGFQLGVLMITGTRRIGIVGMDGYGGYSWSEERSPNKLDRMVELFHRAAPQIRTRGLDVRLGSPRSRITSLPRCKPAELIEWLAS